MFYAEIALFSHQNYIRMLEFQFKTILYPCKIKRLTLQPNSQTKDCITHLNITFELHYITKESESRAN